MTDNRPLPLRGKKRSRRDFWETDAHISVGSCSQFAQTKHLCNDWLRCVRTSGWCEKRSKGIVTEWNCDGGPLVRSSTQSAFSKTQTGPLGATGTTQHTPSQMSVNELPHNGLVMSLGLQVFVLYICYFPNEIRSDCMARECKPDALEWTDCTGGRIDSEFRYFRCGERWLDANCVCAYSTTALRAWLSITRPLSYAFGKLKSVRRPKTNIF